jgi:hypothetical protein
MTSTYLSGTAQGRRLEWIDHLHEHFAVPAAVTDGRYRAPRAPGASTEILPESLAEYSYPLGPAWRGGGDAVSVDPDPLIWGPIVFGGAPIGGLYALVSDEAAAGTLAAAWDAGIRAFDTAPHYGVGVSERRLGSFLAGRPRDEFTMCTKVDRRLVPAVGDVQGEEGFYDIPPLTRVRDYSRDGVRRSLEKRCCSRCASAAAPRCWWAACSTAASWLGPATARPTTTPRPARPAGPGAPDARRLCQLRHPAPRRGAPVHPAPPRRDGRRRRRAQRGRNHGRHLLPLHPHPPPAVVRAASTLT